ncbi:MAG: hypothetical protein KIT18_07025 [Burkholderiales bacterium]|nr:hypothetical protein [Burkholderiales bacterium]
MRVYDPAELTPGRYEVVKRLWVESWRSAFQVPHHPQADAAVRELKSEAAGLGADALLNLACIDDAGGWAEKRGVFCHALAIRLRK